MTTPYDAIVVGLGAMGSSAAFHLARRGARVLGIDRFEPPHAMGSSHGHTRIIRQAYFENPQYVPLVQRAYALWHELEALTGQTLFSRTGGLMIGAPTSDVVTGALRSARQHGLAHELLGTDALRARFPAFRVPDDTVAVLEPDAGYLRPEACVAAHLALARAHGAEVHTRETAIAWEPRGDGMRLTTDHGTYDARRLVIAAGAWAGDLLPKLALPLVVERQVQHWFDPPGDRTLLGEDRFPVFIWEHEPGMVWYGMPLRPEGMKLAIHHDGEPTSAHGVRRAVLPQEVDRVRDLVQRFLPDADGPVRQSTVCLYANTPDDDFIIDAPADLPALIVASPCSGHGFKFSSAIGEAIAELALDGASRADLTPFRLSRFA